MKIAQLTFNRLSYDIRRGQRPDLHPEGSVAGLARMIRPRPRPCASPAGQSWYEPMPDASTLCGSRSRRPARPTCQHWAEVGSGVDHPVHCGIILRRPCCPVRQFHKGLRRRTNRTKIGQKRDRLSLRCQSAYNVPRCYVNCRPGVDIVSHTVVVVSLIDQAGGRLGSMRGCPVMG